jgi:nicotinate-nucleotide adenylyltransferase
MSPEFLSGSSSPRVLCCGGSFNPIHHGHLICARAVAESQGFERIVLIPSARPPHKVISPGFASPEDRLAMCRLAVEGSPLFEVDDIEIRRTGPSYTIDTVRELTARGWPAVHWMIGADMARFLPQWHEPAALMREAKLVVIARPGWEFDWESFSPEFRGLAQNVANAPLIDISATQIRARVAAGKSIEYLTPPAVAAYIRERGLYGDLASR